MRIHEILNEAAMLDVSIKNIDTVFTDDTKAKQFLAKTVEVEEKYDGTKLSLIRNNTPFNTDYRKNWIIAYKNNIIYSSEFSGIGNTNDAIGTSQYKHVHEHLSKIHTSTQQIPKNTEFFVEYMMNKPTLTRKYKTKNGMVLLAYSPVKIKITHGKVKTQPAGFYTANRKEYAKMLGLKIPRVLYAGTLSKLGKGNTPSEILANIKHKLLNIESEFGGKMEGAVIKLDDGTMYKFLQDDQHDNSTRIANKMKYRMDRPSEDAYWKNVRKSVLPIVQKLPKEDIASALQLLSKTIYSKPNNITHGKKNDIQIKDDLFLTAKTILIKKLSGNNGALFTGRFSPPTKAHMKIINAAAKHYDSITLNIVDSKKTDSRNPFPLELQMQLWKAVFPSLEIQTTRTGNLITIINKANNNINVILAGSDRKDGYTEQLARMPDVRVVEIPRTDDVSASKVRQALINDDIATFKQMMHPNTYKFYNKLKHFM